MTPHGILRNGHQQSLQVGHMGTTDSLYWSYIIFWSCPRPQYRLQPIECILCSSLLESQTAHCTWSWKLMPCPEKPPLTLVFYYIPAPTEKSSSNYWKQIYFCSVAWMLKGHCCLGPRYTTTTKNPKFFHVRSKSHCAIEVPHSWQMPKPIIAPTAMTKIITAFPSVKCVPCSVSYLK